MLKERFNSFTKLLIGVFFIVIGTFFFFHAQATWFTIRILVIIGFYIIGFQEFYNLLITRKKQLKGSGMASLIFALGFGTYILFNPTAFYQFVPYITGWWALLNSIVRFINFYVMRRDCLKGKGWVFFEATVTLIIAVVLILNPLRHIVTLSYVSGGYLIFYGITSIIDFNKDIIPPWVSNTVMRHVRIPTPILFAFFIPQRFFISINNLIDTKKLQPIRHPDDNEEINLEVYIYLKEKGPESLGHVDISFEGKIYSYGCHDPYHRSLMGMLGDGVMIIADKIPFLEHAMRSEDKTIIGFGLKLDESQINIIRKRIDSLMLRSMPWSSDAEKEELGQPFEGEGKDYASRVYRNTHAKMVKFNKGRFKTYFVASTNCVLLADYLLRCQELSLISISGIVTPGTYIEFLNSEYLRPLSIVKTRTVYKRIKKHMR